MSRFADLLQNEKMALLETYEVCEYRADDFTDDSERTDQINYAARKVKQDGKPCYVYARTSETREAVDGGDKNNTAAQGP